MGTWRCVALALAAGVVVAPARPVVAQASPADPPLQSAVSLLDNAGYQAALGAPVVGPEDDGGRPGFDGSQQTVARVATTSGLQYTVTLAAYAQPSAAQDAYTTTVQNRLSSETSEPIAGAGEQAAHDGGLAAVLQGAQVLQIELRITGDAEAQLESTKESGGDPTSLAISFNQSVVPLAQALAPRLSGAPVAEPIEIVPVGGADACAGQPALAARVLGSDTGLVGPAQSERPPATMCQLSGPQGNVLVLVVTEAQLAASITPTTLQERYAADLAAAQGSGAAQVAGDTAFTATAPEVMAEALVAGPSGTEYLVTALVAGSFAQSGGEAPFAASLATLVAAVPATIEAPPVVSTTVESTVAPVTTEPSTTEVALGAAGPTAEPPTGSSVAPGAVSGTGGSHGSSSTGTVVLVIVVVVVIAGGAAWAATRRRRGAVAAAAVPRARGVPGESRSEVRDLSGAWNIGVRAVPGASTHEVVEP